MVHLSFYLKIKFLVQDAEKYLKLFSVPGIKSLSERISTENIFFGVCLNGERESGVGICCRLPLVIDVDHFSVGQNLAIPTERERSGDTFFTARSRVGPLRQLRIVIGVIDIAIWNNFNLTITYLMTLWK